MISYNISCSDVLLSIAGGLSGLPYALRHFDAANLTQTSRWEHRIIGVIEAIPVLGLLVAIIEAIAFPCLLSQPNSKTPNNVSPSLVNRISLQQVQKVPSNSVTDKIDEEAVQEYLNKANQEGSSRTVNITSKGVSISEEISFDDE